MSKLAVGVLFGGCSTEHDVSLSSAAAVLKHLNREKYDVVTIGVTRDGRWYRYYGETDGIREDGWSSGSASVPAMLSPNRAMKGLIELTGTEYRFTPLDVVFPVLHGRNGEDGTMQGLLELSGIPFVGCDTLSSAICMDKAISKTLVEAAGIRVPPFMTIAAGEPLTRSLEAADKWGFPLYVKPARSGSSIGITKAYTRQELIAGAEAALLHDGKAVIERHVDGFELGVAVLGSARPITGAIDEIELAGEFFDLTEKYALTTASIHLPARITPEQAEEARETALRIYRLLGCSGLARVDLFRAEDGSLLFNEVNTIPGFTATSRYPSMMREAGIEFPELLDRLIASAVSEARP